MTFKNPVERPWPPQVADERTALAGQLDYHRATILMKFDGLDDEQATRVMVPSGLSMLSLLKHMADNEHSWFAKIFAGLDEPGFYSTEHDPQAE
jgi:hypothetical protein